MNCPHCGKPINPAAMLGSISSPSKTKAARRNAKRGGWPKGKKRGKRKGYGVFQPLRERYSDALSAL